MLLVLRSFISL